MCGSKTTVEAPKPSQTELDIQKLQLETLQRQTGLQEQLLPGFTKVQEQQLGLATERLEFEKGLLPFQLKSMGLQQDPETGEITELPPDELEALLEERAIAALKGELPVSAGTERDIETSRGRLEEGLSRRLGSGFRTSTPGIQSLAEFEERSNILRESERRGDIQSLPTLLGQREALLPSVGSQTLQNLQGFNTPSGSVLSPFSFAKTNFGSALQPFQFNRNQQLQAGIVNAQTSAQRQAGLMQGIGSVVGIAGGVGLAKWLQ